jgi:hypothetical protein
VPAQRKLNKRQNSHGLIVPNSNENLGSPCSESSSHCHKARLTLIPLSFHCVTKHCEEKQECPGQTMLHHHQETKGRWPTKELEEAVLRSVLGPLTSRQACRKIEWTLFKKQKVTDCPVQSEVSGQAAGTCL